MSGEIPNENDREQDFPICLSIIATKNLDKNDQIVNKKENTDKISRGKSQ